MQDGVDFLEAMSSLRVEWTTKIYIAEGTEVFQHKIVTHPVHIFLEVYLLKDEEPPTPNTNTGGRDKEGVNS